LPVRSIVQKSHPSSGSKVKGRGHQGRHKERQGAAFFRKWSSRARSSGALRAVYVCQISLV